MEGDDFGFLPQSWEHLGRYGQIYNVGKCWKNVSFDEFNGVGINHVKTKGAGIAKAGEDLLHLIWMHN